MTLVSMCAMGLLPDAQNYRLRMCRECRESFPRHRLQRKPLVGDPSTHHSTCITHVPWCMSGSLTRGDGENVPGIPGACATLNFTYLARGPCRATCISHIHHYCWRVHWCFLCICFELLSRSKMIIACECDASFGQSKMWIFCRTCKVHHNKILKINILVKLSWGGMVTNLSS